MSSLTRDRLTRTFHIWLLDVALAIAGIVEFGKGHHGNGVLATGTAISFGPIGAWMAKHHFDDR